MVQVRLISRFHDLYLEPALRKLYPQVCLLAAIQLTVHRAATLQGAWLLAADYSDHVELLH